MAVNFRGGTILFRGIGVLACSFLAGDSITGESARPRESPLPFQFHARVLTVVLVTTSPDGVVSVAEGVWVLAAYDGFFSGVCGWPVVREAAGVTGAIIDVLNLAG